MGIITLNIPIHLSTRAIRMIRLLLLTFLFSLLVSCLPQTASNNRLSQQSTTSTTDNDDTTLATLPYDVFWDSIELFPISITINSDIDKNIYLRGNQVNKFLSNDDYFYKLNGEYRPYCMVIAFSSNGSKGQLRVKALPTSSIKDGVKERYLRLEFDATSNSTQAICTGTVQSLNDAAVAFKSTDLCTNCSLKFNSTDIFLYRSDNGIHTNYEVPGTSIDLTGLSIKFDPHSTSTGDATTCSDSQCKALGSDCCLGGQCVTDGVEKPNLDTTTPYYMEAITAAALNENNKKKYKDIFFICPNEPGDVVDNPNDNGTPDHDLIFQQKQDDADCIAGLNSNDYSKCTRSPDFVAPGKEADYKYVKGFILKTCGACNRPQNNFPPYSAEPYCKNWGYFKTYELDGTTIKGTECRVILDTTNNSTAFESQLNLSLSTKTVPHRFYEANSGLAIDLNDFSGLDSTAVLQEGDKFNYQNELDQTSPQNGEFNMNSILGQISVDLKNAHPARTIKVDALQPYIITVNTGSYTSCVNCQTDQWTAKYYPHPSQIPHGLGLQGKGFETSRMGYDQYTGDRGNYEDTIFGRACWIPPTMIVFSHRPLSSSAGTTLQLQREIRLKTQATYFVNGYQRDWYGFNRGAVIGSFDGVSWFAIGESRRIIATSEKLFLAINAPFGDLAENNDLTVNVIRDNPITDASEYDYDPALGDDDITQNKGASCQKFHQCETDTDCVTRLGWEYRCGDISQVKTNWPLFNISAEEQFSSEIAKASFLSPGKILHGVPAGSRKRCIYRGAGSLCKADYTELDAKVQKQFTCAPNFYCSTLSSDDFNREIARMPGELDVILFGQEADILGRPLDYIVRHGSAGIDSDVAENIRHNASIYSNNTGDWGLCRPGKRLSNDPIEQHRFSDAFKRTDYISQISSCDSSTVGTGRISTCPVFTEDESDINFENYTTSSTDFSLHLTQNMCGAESQNNQGDSAFSDIEGAALDTIFYIELPTLAKDACLRRAGAVCHTDFDCSPNKLHLDQAQRRGIEYFGNTLAELNFWKESLICGQAQETIVTRPTGDIGVARYNQFDISKNRCCREVGKDITIYTQASEEMLGVNDKTLVTLDVSKFPNSNPRSDGRYSRFTSIGTFEAPPADPYEPYYSKPKVITSNGAPNGIKPESFQWKAIHDTAKKTCCGSGWIRKFSDGTNVWPSYSKININPTNFKCLNYQNELALLEKSELPGFNLTSRMLSQQDMLCENPSIGGCIETPIRTASLFEVRVPIPITTAIEGELNTTPKDHDDATYQDVSNYAPYMPVAYRNTIPVPNVGYNYFNNNDGNTSSLSIILPMYIGGKSNITSVYVQYAATDGNGDRVIGRTVEAAAIPDCDYSGSNPIIIIPAVLLEHQYCFDANSSPGYMVMHVRPNLDSTELVNGGPWQQAGLIIKFNVANSSAYSYTGGVDSSKNGATAGNAMYYLTKLGKLELMGIPQIFYDPIYCNSNGTKLVEGLYDPSIKTRSDFFNNSFNFANFGEKSLAQIYDQKSSGLTGGQDRLNPNEEAVIQTKMGTQKVFSSTEFKCCLQLGETTTQEPKNVCCAGAGTKDDETGISTCMLPAGTDLNVYFNRYVSGEGIDVDDELKFIHTDFIPETGEPKLDSKVYDKIVALGKKYCTSGAVRKGGAFGHYNAGNSSTFNTYGHEEGSCDYKQFQILDNSRDNEGDEACDGTGTLDKNSKAGFNAFNSGYRWNHHYYCTPDS